MKLRRFLLGAATGFVAGYVALRTFDAVRELRAQSMTSRSDTAAYGRLRRALAVSGVARSLVGTFAFAYGPGADAADRIASRMPQWLAPIAFALATTAAAAVLEAPIEFVEGFHVERRYGLSEQSTRDWVVDYVKGSILSAGLASLLAGLGAAVLRKAPRAWPWIAAGGTLPLLVLANVIVPVFILPLFNAFTPLEGPLEERLRALASRFGVGDAEILRMDMSRQTKKANAFVAGVGSTHRIVIGDTLLENFPPEEIEFVVAHELGHYVSRDTWRMVAVAQMATTILLLFSARRLTSQDLARPSLAIARVIAWITMGTQAIRPLIFAFSRSREWAADRFAVDATREPRTGAAAFRRLRDQNRAEERLPMWYQLLFSSHPTLGDRIEALDHDRTFGRR
jgi:STE24 endopeptidase